MLLYKEESYAIIGACMEVHNTLGCGFLEAVYQEALAIEFEKRKIPFVREAELCIEYKGIILAKKFNAELCNGFSDEEIETVMRFLDSIMSIAKEKNK